MNPTNTLELILQYAYGETDASTSSKVEALIESNPELRQYYSEICEVKTALNSVQAVPDPTSVAIICEHSHDSHTEAV